MPKSELDVNTGIFYIFCLIYQANNSSNDNESNLNSSLLDIIKENIIVVLICGAQTFFQEYAFECPITSYREYAMLIIFAPTVPLFCLSLLIHQDFACVLMNLWQHCITCKRKQAHHEHSFGDEIFICIHHLLIYTVAPLTWVVLCFLRKSLWICACLGPLDEYMSNGTLPINVDTKVKELSATSQKMGVVILNFIVIGLTVVAFIHRCRLGRNRNADETESKRFVTNALYRRYEGDH